MKFDLSVLFTLKKGKADKVGQMPIYLRITVNGERVELSTNRKIEELKWDSKMQRAKGRSESARNLNEYLDSIENNVKKEFNWLLDNEKPVSATILRDILNSDNKRENFLIQVFELNNKLIAQEEGDKYTLSTINQYKPSNHKFSWDNLFSTHPPIEKRIELLEQFI